MVIGLLAIGLMSYTRMETRRELDVRYTYSEPTQSVEVFDSSNRGMCQYIQYVAIHTKLRTVE